MKILLIGKRGQVGSELAAQLPSLGEVIALGREELDLRDSARIRSKVRMLEPELIVNAAAYTAVDRAEGEPEMARSVNTIAPMVLAEEAARLDAVLVHYSTDYVFDGEKGEPYLEHDPPNPLNVYGRTKLEGERAVQATAANALILRTSWVYGLHGDNFVNKVLRWAAENAELQIVADQVSGPTWAVRVAEITVQLLRSCSRASIFPSSCKGLFHLASAGSASRYSWAQAIVGELPPGRVPQLIPAMADEFPTPAKRPRYSALDSSKLAAHFGVVVPDWRDDLRLAMTMGMRSRFEIGASESV